MEPQHVANLPVVFHQLPRMERVRKVLISIFDPDTANSHRRFDLADHHPWPAIRAPYDIASPYRTLFNFHGFRSVGESAANLSQNPPLVTRIPTDLASCGAVRPERPVWLLQSGSGAVGTRISARFTPCRTRVIGFRHWPMASVWRTDAEDEPTTMQRFVQLRRVWVEANCSR